MISQNEVTYKRELNHNYMVIRCNETDMADRYAYRVLNHNHIGKLLDCSLRQLDGDNFLYYDITSRQPLERLYEAKKLGMEELGQMLCSIAAVQEDLGEYLLDEQGLLLETGKIFADVETEELFFCYDPGSAKGEAGYAALADFFLEHVDHGEEHAVTTAYQFYKMSKAEYFVLNSFLPFLERETALWKSESGPAAALSWKEESPGEMDIVEEEDPVDRKEPEKAVKKESWFSRIFRRRKRESAPVIRQEEWPDTVWDSYESQLHLPDSQETIYLTDLDRTENIRGKKFLLQETEGDRQFYLENFPVTVGKLKGRASILLSDASVSRIHSRFEAGDDGIYLRDLNSRNGTKVNDKKLAPNEAVMIKAGDILRFGRESFRVERV